MSKRKDSVAGIITVATVLCIVCSIIVSATAVGLRSKQKENALADKKKNILLAAGIIEAGESVDLKKAFANIDAMVIDLESGKPIADLDAETFDARAQMQDAENVVRVPAGLDDGKVSAHAKRAVVYVERNDDKSVRSVILPIHGSGLWSTMYGFLALEPDLSTVKGLVYYEQGETPGLGAEVDADWWLSQWRDPGEDADAMPRKELFDEQGDYAFRMIKGRVEMGDPMASHKADGISGATITVNGVGGMLRYWMETGYAPFFEWLRANEKMESADG